MTEDIHQITADRLRADFMNAATTWERWKVLNEALEWAVSATRNAEHERHKRAVLQESLITVQQTRDLYKGMLTAKSGCHAVQMSDQMVCATCDMTWDAGDANPPACTLKR